jgi:hypothetical protein
MIWVWANQLVKDRLGDTVHLPIIISLSSFEIGRSPVVIYFISILSRGSLSATAFSINGPECTIAQRGIDRVLGGKSIQVAAYAP